MAVPLGSCTTVGNVTPFAFFKQVFVDITVDSTPGAQVLCEAMMHEGILSIPMGFSRWVLLCSRKSWFCIELG